MYKCSTIYDADCISTDATNGVTHVCVCVREQKFMWMTESHIELILQQNTLIYHLTLFIYIMFCLLCVFFLFLDKFLNQWGLDENM